MHESRGLITRLLLAIGALASLAIIGAFLGEYVTERRAAARLMPGQTFARVADETIRYRLRGTEHPRRTMPRARRLSSQVARKCPLIAYSPSPEPVLECPAGANAAPMPRLLKAKPQKHARIDQFECNRVSGNSAAMDEPAIYAGLTNVFQDVFDDDIELRPDLAAKDVDGWDSLTHIRLMLTVEKAFKVKFSTSEIGALKNVGDLVRLIGKRTQQS
jgi:acyl carrier protein